MIALVLPGSIENTRIKELNIYAMKKCLILFALLVAVLAAAGLADRTNDELPENTLAISKIDVENSVLHDKLGE